MNQDSHISQLKTFQVNPLSRNTPPLTKLRIKPMLSRSNNTFMAPFILHASLNISSSLYTHYSRGRKVAASSIILSLVQQHTVMFSCYCVRSVLLHAKVYKGAKLDRCYEVTNYLRRDFTRTFLIFQMKKAMEATWNHTPIYKELAVYHQCFLT